jgi:hypothetical protein
MLKSYGVLGPSAVRATLVAGAVVLGVATVAGIVRILPWIVAPDVPVGLAIPFARGLLAVGLETALLCAPPIGWALAASGLVDRGETRALFAIGASPSGIVRTTLGPVLIFACLAAVAALSWGTEAAAPGRLGREMIDRARGSCAGVSDARAVQIPFLRASWLCFPGAPPRIVGPLPGAAIGMFSAAGLSVSDDLHRVTAVDMRVLLGQAGTIRLSADRATLRNVAPFGRASTLRPARRSALLSVTGALLALLSAWAVVRSGRASLLFALSIGAAGPVAALCTLTFLEQRSAVALAYLAIPAVAVGTALLVSLTWRLLRPG